MLETEPDDLDLENARSVAPMWYSLVSLMTAKDIACVMLVIAVAMVSKMINLVVWR